MTSRQKLQAALAHQEGPVPVDFGGTFVSGIHVSVVAALRERLGLERRLVRVIDPGQMLGEVDDELKDALGVDVEPVRALNTRFGFPLDAGWKPWRAPWGQEVLVSGGFVTSTEPNGDTLIYPQSDREALPSARIPAGGYFADAIVRQYPIDEDRLDPRDNLEEFPPISDAALDHFRCRIEAASATGRGVVAGFGGTALGDIGAVPAPGLKRPKGIRDMEDQKTLPFGTPAEVRAQALERCRIFAAGGGFVFNAIHNIQARTPVENVMALLDAVREFNNAGR
jgi:hypothetical protein